MSWLLAAVAAVILFWVISLARILSSSSCVPSDPGFLHSGFGKRRNVLLVIAHPDDESIEANYTCYRGPCYMGFGPLISTYAVVCSPPTSESLRSSGFADPMFKALSLFSDVIHSGGFPNSFAVGALLGFGRISHNLVRKVFHDMVSHWNFMLLSDSNQKHIEAWELVSLSIFRKYSGPVDVWLSIIFSSFYLRKQIYCLLNNNPSLSFLAMAAHRSQWIWFRKLFVGFSTYTYMNTLRKINVE
ncbi:hypothetical protein ZIOFF_016386 [Zingiber officinale]|uniref:N-acetylglucosaminylphosphatidylinositol deacetylase n=1 Tax=Zingiber officinale TaxID=94328 RepID=A0A8J5I2L9_ZINOF|nr:hypothetical protein ZIOFF_016386 [Zingiber officinale]